MVWSLARPVWAGALPAAPLCDDRGATVLALPPTLQAPDEAIIRARAPSCDRGGQSLFATVGVGRIHLSSTPDVTQAALPTRPSLAFSCTASEVGPPRVFSAHCGGARSRVERPPR